MKQTAVEWLVEQYKKVGGISISMAEIAKEMEREQIKDAYWASYKEGQYSGDKTADEYYNETFKQQAKEMEKFTKKQMLVFAETCMLNLLSTKPDGSEHPEISPLDLRRIKQVLTMIRNTL